MERESGFTLCQLCCKCYIILLVFNIFFFFACSNETESPTTISTSDEQTVDASVDLTSEEFHEFRDTTFQELQDLFESPILDEHFETLHKISTSDLYLGFLKKVYPDVLPHQNFKAFVKNSPPNAEVYTPLLKRHFEKVTKADVIAVNRLHQGYQKGRILIYHGMDRLAVEEKVLTPIFRKEPVWNWFMKRGRDEKVYDTFDADFQRLSEDIERANIEKINQILKEQRRERRPDDGFIWLMLTEPVLMGEVLDSFSDTEIFSKWLKGEFKELKLRF